TLIMSLLPGYFSGRIYTYGWQYGYFPGFVWDEAMELSTGYWISRIIEIALIVILLIYNGNSIKNQRTIKKTIALIIVILLSGIIYANQLTNFSLQELLSDEIIISQVHLHFKSGSLSPDEAKMLEFNSKRF